MANRLISAPCPANALASACTASVSPSLTGQGNFLQSCRIFKNDGNLVLLTGAQKKYYEAEQKVWGCVEREVV